MTASRIMGIVEAHQRTVFSIVLALCFWTLHFQCVIGVTYFTKDDLFKKYKTFPKTSAVNKTSFTPEEKNLILQLSNAYRSIVYPPAFEMRELTWDDDLEQYTKNHTQACTGAHSSGTMRKKEDIYNENSWTTWTLMGEVLYYSFGGVYNIEEAFYLFWEEGSKYDIGTNNCTHSNTCGHYKVMTTDHSSKIGCALNICNNFTVSKYPTPAVFFMCSYDGMFLSDDRPYTVGVSCEGCTQSRLGYWFQYCRNRLCIGPNMRFEKSGFNGSTALLGFDYNNIIVVNDTSSIPNTTAVAPKSTTLSTTEVTTATTTTTRSNTTPTSTTPTTTTPTTTTRSTTTPTTTTPTTTTPTTTTPTTTTPATTTPTTTTPTTTTSTTTTPTTSTPTTTTPTTTTRSTTTPTTTTPTTTTPTTTTTTTTTPTTTTPTTTTPTTTTRSTTTPTTTTPTTTTPTTTTTTTTTPTTTTPTTTTPTTTTPTTTTPTTTTPTTTTPTTTTPTTTTRSTTTPTTTTPTTTTPTTTTPTTTTLTTTTPTTTTPSTTTPPTTTSTIPATTSTAPTTPGLTTPLPTTTPAISKPTNVTGKRTISVANPTLSSSWWLRYFCFLLAFLVISLGVSS